MVIGTTDEPLSDYEQRALDWLKSQGARHQVVTLPTRFPLDAMTVMLGVEATTVFDDILRSDPNADLGLWPDSFRKGQFHFGGSVLASQSLANAIDSRDRRSPASDRCAVGCGRPGFDQPQRTSESCGRVRQRAEERSPCATSNGQVDRCHVSRVDPAVGGQPASATVSANDSEHGPTVLGIVVRLSRVSLDHGQQIARFDLQAALDQQLLDDTRPISIDDRLHLHGLQCHQFVTFIDLISSLNRYRDDHTGHAGSNVCRIVGISANVGSRTGLL